MKQQPDTSATRLALPPGRDNGSILPIVLVVTVVLSAVVVAVATYVATDLRYGQVVEARAGRISAAQGAMDDALEQLTIKNPICSSSGPAGLDTPFPQPINGATVVVNCKVTGAVLPPLDGWALVVTGEGAPNDGSDLLAIDNSKLVEIGGPVYLQIPARTDFKKAIQIVDGDLWHPDTTCAESDPSNPAIQYDNSPLSISNLSYSPGRGAYCINRTWQQLFGTGPTVSPNVATMQANPTAWNPPFSVDGSCRVFSPGYYTSLDLGTSNYFRSGEYVFDNIGTVALQGKHVTMGQINRQGFPAVGNVACDPVRNADATTGATVYTKGNTRFSSRANSGLEISGRQQDNAVVALQVLDSSLGFSNALLHSDNGNQKEAAFQGMVWAPYNSVDYETVPSDKAAILRGGAVVAKFEGKVAASASGFLIEIATSPASTKLLLEATATDSRGTNAVRAVVDYRPATGETAANSRRVRR